MKQVGLGICQHTNGNFMFAPKQIYAVAVEQGATEDQAAELVGALLGRAYAAEQGQASSAVDRMVAVLRGTEA